MKEGYKKTELGWIPEEWDIKKLDDICIILDAKRKPIKASDRENMKGNIPYYGASGVIDWVNEYIFDDELVLLGEDGENIKSRNLPLAFRVSGKCWVNNHAHVFKVRENNDIDYMTYVLESKDYSQYVIGSAQPKLTQSDCKKILLQVPPLNEQEKIADILSTVDSQIDDTDKLIEKTKELKKGLMQRLLTKGIGHKEFKKTEVGEIPVEWEVKQLKDIIQEFIVPMRDKPKKFDGNIPWCRIEDIEGKYFNTSKDNKFVSMDTINEMNLKVYPVNSLICSCSASLGVYAINTQPLITNQTFIGLVPSIDVDIMFLYYCMDNSTERLKSISSGTTIPYISKKKFEDFKIKLPNINEQKKIANILSSVDNQIEEYENKKSKLEELKKGLMQQLLTGKIRVKI